MKKIGVIYYSQSGRTEQVIQQIKKEESKMEQNVIFSFFPIKPKIPFEFPLSFSSFMGLFPGSILQKPTELLLINHKNENFDLILLVYSVWYLSPSIPVSSFLQSPQAKEIIKDTPVVTVITCRDMWIQAQKDVSKAVTNVGSKVIGNVVLRDEHNSFQSLVTTLFWFLTGKNEKPFGIFPKPLLKEKQLGKISLLQGILMRRLKQNSLKELQTEVIEKDLFLLDSYKIPIESRIKKIFQLWAYFINSSRSPRSKKIRFLLFELYLVFAIVIIMPLAFVISLLLFPFMQKKIRIMREKALMGK